MHALYIVKRRLPFQTPKSPVVIVFGGVSSSASIGRSEHIFVLTQKRILTGALGHPTRKVDRCALGRVHGQRRSQYGGLNAGTGRRSFGFWLVVVVSGGCTVGHIIVIDV